jgi:hypothetical protein
LAHFRLVVHTLKVGLEVIEVLLVPQELN